MATREPLEAQGGLETGTEHFADVEEKPLGPVAAAMIAGGVGSLVLGIMTTLSEVSESIHDFLQWNDAVGPLSGKTLVAVIAWLVAWALLHLVYRGRDTSLRTAFTITLVLVALGVLGTFPTFFAAFASE